MNWASAFPLPCEAEAARLGAWARRKAKRRRRLKFSPEARSAAVGKFFTALCMLPNVRFSAEQALADGRCAAKGGR